MRNLGVVLVAALGMAGVACEPSSSSSSSSSSTSSGGAPPAPGDGNETPVASECAAKAGPGLLHPASPHADETWTAAASPHILPSDFTVYKTITIEPCAEVLIAPGATLSVAGKLIADGTPSRPHPHRGEGRHEAFRDDPDCQRNARSRLRRYRRRWLPQNAVPFTTGMLNLQGLDETLPSQETIKVDHVVLSGSATNGIVLRDGAGFAKGSDALTVKGSALYPVNIWARAAGGLPSGSYTGNAKDEILLESSHAYSNFGETTTLRTLGVPYHVGTDQNAGDLRIDPQLRASPRLP